ncbi:MAG: hypothetical protein QGH40_14880 [bacterium]|nr:hypothetical protein [bacterium]
MRKLTLTAIILILGTLVFNVGFCKVNLTEQEEKVEQVEKLLLPKDTPRRTPTRTMRETSPMRHYTETPAGPVHSDYGLHYTTI